jgi:hypothetical protein
MSKETTTPTAQRGRPTVEGSKRQAVLAMRAAKVAAGGTIQRGRPKNPIVVTVDVVKKTRTTKTISGTPFKVTEITPDIAIMSL